MPVSRAHDKGDAQRNYRPLITPDSSSNVGCRSVPEVQGELNWNGRERLWEFPAEATKAVVAAIRAGLPDMDVQQPPQKVIKLLSAEPAGA